MHKCMQSAKKGGKFGLQKIALNQVITTFLQRKKRAYIPAWLQVHVFYELGQKVIDFILQTRNHHGEQQTIGSNPFRRINFLCTFGL